MITIYHLGVSQSDRIVWLMEELGLPYELEWFDRNEEGIAPDEYMALHPAATAPIIKDDDLVLPESAAIVEYISHKYAGGKLTVPPSSDNYVHYLYWMQFNNNLTAVVFAKAAAGENTDPDDMIMKVALRREAGYFAFLEQRLGEADYLAGDEFTCADIMTIFSLTTMAAHLGKTFEDQPNISAYIERITQRPAYQKAMSIAGVDAQKPA